MGISANVVDGELKYNYTDQAAKKQQQGSNLGYDQFLQLLCAEMQYQDPLEPTNNTDYVAQLATFSELEATLSQTTTQQSNLANNLVGQEVVIKDVAANGSVNYISGKVDYVMYQDGDIYLSVNDGLYTLDKLDTVADSNYYEAVALGKSLTGMLEALPSIDNLTPAYKGAIEEAREVYDSMTDYQKKFVDDKVVGTLHVLEERLKELLHAQENETNEDSTEQTDVETQEA